MKPSVELKKLQTVTQKIIDQYSPEKIILFGSYAWGKPTKDSDFDLLIVKKNKGDFFKEHGAVRDIINGEIAVDILIRTPQELDKRIQMGDFFYRRIINKGKYLYGAHTAKRPRAARQRVGTESH